jgi:hypothetical protein
MSSLEIAASPPIRHDETVQIALLLAFAGGNAASCVADRSLVSRACDH